MDSNISLYIQKLSYEDKATVNSHVKQFLDINQFFTPRINQAVIPNTSLNIIYLEVVGFIEISEELHQFRIKIPHNYPKSYPEYVLIYNSQSHEIANKEALLRSKLIEIIHAEKSQLLIQLKFPKIRQFWMHETKNICNLTNQVVKLLNNPKFLIPVQKSQRNISLFTSALPMNFVRRKSSRNTEDILCQMQNQIITLQEKHSQVQQLKSNSYYEQARLDFFKKSMPRLSKGIQAKKKQLDLVNKKLEELNKRSCLEGNIDALVDFKQKDKKKIKVLAKIESVQQVQKKLKDFIESEIRKEKRSFGEFKGLLKVMFEKSFEAKAEFYKICD